MFSDMPKAPALEVDVAGSTQKSRLSNKVAAKSYCFAQLSMGILVVLSLSACKNKPLPYGGPVAGNPGGLSPANESSPSPQGTPLPPAALTNQQNASVQSNPSSAEAARAAAKTICTSPPGSTSRAQALTVIENYTIGSQPWNATTAASSPTACVDALKLGAVYVNLVSGVPAGTILGQALQETGFCKSDLARQAYNFHGMKAHVPLSAFTYWKGEKFRKASTESTTGSGNLQVSDFMKFQHADHGFYSLAERLIIPSLPYLGCFANRDATEPFMRCIGRAWAVHTHYAQAVLQHRAQHELGGCELKKSEWKLKGKWVGK